MSEGAVQPVRERRPAKQVADPELIAMHEIVETLGELPEKSQSRVVMWMHDRWLSEDEPRV